MEIDPCFLRELRDLDDRLNVGWNAIQERFQIVREARRFAFMGFLNATPLFQSYPKPHFIFTVENEDGSYRSLDSRTIDKLKCIDLYRYSRVGDFLKGIEDKEDAEKERRNKRLDQDIHDLTMDNIKRLQDGIEDLRSM